MKIIVLPDGNLKFETTPAEGGVLLLNRDRKDFNSDDYTKEFFEETLNLSEYYWSSPESIGALTNAPIIVSFDGDGEIIEAWGFMNYDITSPQLQLLEKGYCIFQKG